MIDAFLDIEGTPVHYIDSAGHGPTVLCAHGNSSAGDAFRRLFERLAPDVRGIAFDLHGHGDTPGPALAGGALAGYAELIRAVARRLVSGPLLLVGHSLGGHAVMEALPLFEDGAVLEGVVCLASPPFNVASVGDVFRDPSEGLVFQDALSADEAVRLADSFVRRDNVTDAAYRAIVRRILNVQSGVRPRIGRALAEGMFADEVALYRRARCPVVFIQGKEDRFIDSRYYKTLPIDERRDRVVLLDGVGHSPHLEAVGAVDAAIRRCLAWRAPDRDLPALVG